AFDGLPVVVRSSWATPIACNRMAGGYYVSLAPRLDAKITGATTVAYDPSLREGDPPALAGQRLAFDRDRSRDRQRASIRRHEYLIGLDAPPFTRYAKAWIDRSLARNWGDPVVMKDAFRPRGSTSTGPSTKRRRSSAIRACRSASRRSSATSSSGPPYRSAAASTSSAASRSADSISNSARSSPASIRLVHPGE